jgi:hypothetical protein
LGAGEGEIAGFEGWQAEGELMDLSQRIGLF